MSMSRSSMSVAASPSARAWPDAEDAPDEIVLLNKAGQKLGRKGLETRAKILAAMQQLLASAPHERLTPSSIARCAGLASQSFYLYFEDIKEVLLALCEETVAEVPPIVALFQQAAASGDEADMAAFIRAHYEFSRRHLALFTLRNYYSDNGERPFYTVRSRCSVPILQEIAKVIAARGNISDVRATARAVVIIAGLDRMSSRPDLSDADGEISDTDLLRAEADILSTLLDHAGYRS